MSIETDCQGCGQRLRLGDEHAGKRARCPNCQAINPIPIGMSNTPSTLALPFAPGVAAESLWTLKIDDGRTFGPVERAILDEWFQGGRITPNSRLQCSGDHRWLSAATLYPSLLANEAIPSFGVAGKAVGNDDLANPYAPPAGDGGIRAWNEPHNGGAVLTLGIVSVALCVLLGPVAAYLGHSSLRAIRDGRMDPAGQGLLLAGTILGWIGTVQMLGVFGCFGLGIAAGPPR